MDEIGSADDDLHWIAEWEATPTHKRARPYLDGRLPPYEFDTQELTFEDHIASVICSIRALGALVRDEDECEGGQLSFVESASRRALENLQEIARLHPEAAEPARSAAAMMMLSWVAVSSRLTSEQIEREVPVIRPLIRRNAKKAAAAERAQAIAAELWQADTAQEIRLGDMADRVYRALVAEGFAESLPGSAERIKEWIKPAAPDYARKGGRRRKTP